MAKAKISDKQKASLKKTFVKVDKTMFEEYRPLEFILNKENILRAIAECLQKGDFEGILEVIQIYKRALKRAKKYKAEMENSDNPEQAHWEGCSNSQAILKIAHSKSNDGLKKLKVRT